MVDGLDVVTVGVENVGRVVARVVRAFAGRAVVLPSGRDRGGVEAPHRFLVLGLERDVHALGRRPVVAHEELVGPEVALPAVQLDPEGAERGLVETTTRLEVSNAQVDVVEEPAPVKLHTPTMPRPLP